jgi:hypothetical protein
MMTRFTFDLDATPTLARVVCSLVRFAIKARIGVAVDVQTCPVPDEEAQQVAEARRRELAESHSHLPSNK